MMTPQRFHQLQLELKILENLEQSVKDYKHYMKLNYRLADMFPNTRIMHKEEAKRYKQLYWNAFNNYQKVLQEYRQNESCK